MSESTASNCRSNPISSKSYFLFFVLVLGFSLHSLQPSNPLSSKTKLKMMINHNIIIIILNSLSSPLLIHSYIIIFSLITTTTLGVIDPHYETCKPQTCGNNQTISYPFYIQGRQQPYCGYPGFGITCSRDGYPILNLSNTAYIIDQIFYENASLRVSNAILSRWGTNSSGCLSLTQNLTLPPGNRFSLGQTKKDIILFFDCDLSLLPRGMEQHSIGCSAGNEKNSVMALYKDDKDLNLVSKSCRGEMVDAVVVEDGNNGSTGNIGEALRRGLLLNWTASDCNLCRSTGGRCGFNSTFYTFSCFCTDKVHASSCPGSSSRSSVKIALAVGLAVTVTLLLLVVVTLYTRWKMKNSKHRLVDSFLERHGHLQIKKFSYSEIKKVTNCFRNKLGQGGFGSVYKGQLHDGRYVAVKLLSGIKGDGEEFMNEVASMSRTSHVNIVVLLGFCFEYSRRALVYEFMPNGSLEKFIYEENAMVADRQLDCQTLYDIAIGVARGLEYLHKGCRTRILHFDIKPHNILLDENLCPKISDFGLAKVCTGKESMVSIFGARGTAGYIAPEVFSRDFGAVSHKSDVYSYGMMVLEMVGRRRNIKVDADASSELYFPHWIYNRLVSNQELCLQSVENESDDEKMRKMTIVSLWCIQTKPSTRPSITKVVEMLEGRVELLQLPPKPFWFTPANSPDHLSCEQ